jgi:Uncharacterised nucleotidyltransferase
MKKKTQNYLCKILSAWARDLGQEGSAPVPLPEGVEGREVCDVLISHQVQVALSPYIPEEAFTLEFRENLASSKERTAFLLLELERILPSITWDSCRPVVLKGAGLAQAYYSNPNQRWFLDLDILVPRGQVDEVCQRLESVGYQQYYGERDPLYYELHHLHRIMVGPQGSCVEIHWDLTLPASKYGFDVPGVFNRAKPMELGRTTMLTASPVDQVLHGLYQHIADGFLDLKRLLDLVLLVSQMSEKDSLYIMKESERTNMNYALGLTLHVMKKLCGVDFPVPPQAHLFPSWTVNRIIHGLEVDLGMLERRAEKTEGYTALLHLLMVPGPSRKIHEVNRFVWQGEAELMDIGHWRDDLPGWGRRLRISLYFMKTLLNMGGRATKALVRG